MLKEDKVVMVISFIAQVLVVLFIILKIFQNSLIEWPRRQLVGLVVVVVSLDGGWRSPKRIQS